MNEIFAAFFLGGLVGLDTTAAWQVLLSHPLIACSLLGAVFGEPQLGLFFGIIFELVWLYDVPVGGARFPEGSLGSFVGLMIALSIMHNGAISESWLVLLSCGYAVMVAYIFGYSIVRLRRFNVRLIGNADRFADKGDVRGVERAHRSGLLITYLYVGSLSLLFFLVGQVAVSWLLKVLPETAPFSVADIRIVFLGVGITVMIHTFLQRRNLRYLLMAIGAGIFLTVVL
jgi:mannose/fructose/N-acetylgalactosamine-specific phosphotransferase system component IIC